MEQIQIHPENRAVLDSSATADRRDQYRDGTEPMRTPNVLVGMLAHQFSLCYVNTYLKISTLNSWCPHHHRLALLGHWHTVHGNRPCLWTSVACRSPTEALWLSGQWPFYLTIVATTTPSLHALYPARTQPRECSVRF